MVAFCKVDCTCKRDKDERKVNLNIQVPRRQDGGSADISDDVHSTVFDQERKVAWFFLRCSPNFSRTFRAECSAHQTMWKFICGQTRQGAPLVALG